jgi:glucokinase
MIVSDSSFVLSYDVGGSHISAGLCNLSNLELINVVSAPLASVATFDAFADLIHCLGLKSADGEPNIVGASLAVPGPFDTLAGASLMEHKLTYLYRRDLRSALAERFSFAPDRLCFINDAAAYVLGEFSGGSIRGGRRAAGLTLGTGVGAAFAVDGQHVTSGPGVPPGGEIWNYPYAGGIVEDLISTRRIKADYLARTGRHCEVADIAAFVPTEPDARAIFDLFGQHLGEVLRDVVAPFHPDSVVIGGGISRSANLFLPIVEKLVVGLGFRLATSSLLERAALVGAAHHWRELSRNFAQHLPAPVA